LEAWDIPAPLPLLVPDSIEAGRGVWRGRAVLLAWPKGVAVSENPPMELQGCDEGSDPVLGWKPVPWVLQHIQERPHVVAAPLPFDSGRFRWWSRDRRVGGPRSEPCVAAVETPPEPEIQVFCSRTAVQVHVRITLAHYSHRAVPVCQMRYQQMQYAEDAMGVQQATLAGDWQTPLSADIRVQGSYPDVVVDAVFGEADGLELGCTYAFSARCGNHCRRSPWSAASAAVAFDVPAGMAPQAGEGNELLVEAITSSSVRFWWREIRAPEALSPRTREPADGRLRLEYCLQVSRVLRTGGLERHANVLLEDAENGAAPFDAAVGDLQRGGKYFAALAVRFACVGQREWMKTGLKASFEMPSAPEDAM